MIVLKAVGRRRTNMTRVGDAEAMAEAMEEAMAVAGAAEAVEEEAAEVVEEAAEVVEEEAAEAVEEAGVKLKLKRVRINELRGSGYIAYIYLYACIIIIT